MGDVTRFMHITSLSQLAQLSEEDAAELERLIPDHSDLMMFIRGNRIIAEEGAEKLLETDAAYPSQANAYKDKAA